MYKIELVYIYLIYFVDKNCDLCYNFNVYYHVKDNIFDINNWKKFVVDWKTKETKKIELK